MDTMSTLKNPDENDELANYFNTWKKPDVGDKNHKKQDSNEEKSDEVVEVDEGTQK